MKGLLLFLFCFSVVSVTSSYDKFRGTPLVPGQKYYYPLIILYSLNSNSKYLAQAGLILVKIFNKSPYSTYNFHGPEYVSERSKRGKP